MSDTPAPIALLRRLVDLGEQLTANRATTMSSAAIRELRDQVQLQVMKPCDDVRLIGGEAVCLVELLAELTYARADKNATRESRMIALINAHRGFLLTDLLRAEKEALS